MTARRRRQRLARPSIAQALAHRQFSAKLTP